MPAIGHDAEAWRELIDLGALARWMDARGLGDGAIESPHTLSGGTQNILLRFTRGGESFVLRRPPRVAEFFTINRFVRIADGPDEVHTSQLGKQKIREYNEMNAR